eukprot:4192036-Lingulodinium_polyedra.AAC.1
MARCWRPPPGAAPRGCGSMSCPAARRGPAKGACSTWPPIWEESACSTSCSYTGRVTARARRTRTSGSLSPQWRGCAASA